MILLCGGAALVVLALITQLGVVWLQRAHPPSGRMIDVAGGRLHVVELGPADAAGPAIVMIHGASSNLKAMQLPLGDRLAEKHRVILIDRPGHGWSARDDLANSTPAAQANMIDQALATLRVDNAILVVHSMAGALGLLMALDHPQRLSGLVMLAPVAYPWPGGVGAYNEIVTTPVIGPLLAYTITLPLGLLVTEAGARGVFMPQTMPPDYIKATATQLLLRPREFLANAFDLVTLKAAVAAQAPRYPGIRLPLLLIAGDADKTVFTAIHSRPLAAVVPGAKLIVIPGLGHMVQNAEPDLVIAEIEAMIATVKSMPKAAMRQ